MYIISRNVIELSLYQEAESFLNAKGFFGFFMVSSKRFLHNKITPGISVMYMDL